jgi:amino acid transporter
MAAIEVEHTTKLALEEKAKLKKSFRRFDMILFTICAMVGMDLIGSIASTGLEAVTWMIVLAVLFLVPYGLIMSELGTSFPEEGGPYEWVKLAFGRVHAAIFTVFYWITNPFWVGGSLAFTAVAAIDSQWFGVGSGSFLDYLLKIIFIWVTIGVAIASLDKGKWIPNVGAMGRGFLVVTFVLTVGIYAIKNGIEEGLVGADLQPTVGGFLGIVPLAVFAFVGFELQSNAAEEMVSPQKDVPVSVFRAGVFATIAYILPILGVLFVLPLGEIDGLDAFINATDLTFTDVWGDALGGFLLQVTVALLILALATSGASWIIGSDRTAAVAAYDGAFFPYFGRIDDKLGTPVRVNVLTGIVGTIFCVVATIIQTSGGSSAQSMFGVVLTIAITTTLISYLWVFPAAYALRRGHPGVARVYRVPGGDTGMLVAAVLTTFFAFVGSFEALFPGVLWKVVGEDYGSFFDAWGVSRTRFEVLTLGTVALVIVLAFIGYASGKRVREEDVVIPIGEAAGG